MCSKRTWKRRALLFYSKILAVCCLAVDVASVVHDQDVFAGNSAARARCVVPTGVCVVEGEPGRGRVHA